jgi:hypothetical protein
LRVSSPKKISVRKAHLNAAGKKRSPPIACQSVISLKCINDKQQPTEHKPNESKLNEDSFNLDEIQDSPRLNRLSIKKTSTSPITPSDCSPEKILVKEEGEQDNSIHSVVGGGSTPLVLANSKMSPFIQPASKRLLKNNKNLRVGILVNSSAKLPGTRESIN